MGIKKFVLIISFTFISQLLYSQNGWFNQFSGTTQPLNSVYFINEFTGFAGGGTPNTAIILKTTNAGLNWNVSYQSYASAAVFSIVFLNSNTGYVAGGYNPVSYTMKTTDAGLTWNIQYTGMPYAMFSIYMTDVNTGYSTGDWGHIIKTTNGSTWFSLPSCTGDYLECITFVNNTTGYAVGRAGQIVKTTDAGNSWSYLVSYGNWLNSVKFINGNVGYTVGHYGTILVTENSGVTWNSRVSGTSNDLNEICFVNSSTGYIAGNSGIILCTSNGGTNWDFQQTGTNSGLLSVFFLNSSTGYSTGMNGTIIKTITGGMSTVVPTLISPSNNSYGVSLTPTLFWTSPSVLNYKVEVSSLSNFSVIVDSATVTTNQRTIPPGKLNLGTTYFWRVNATSNLGTGPWSEIWNFGTVTTGINHIGENIPRDYNLYYNYPNPFNPTTKIRFDLPNNSRTKLIVYDISGKEVSKPLDAQLNAGTYEINFDAGKLSSGVYFYRLETEKFTDVKRMILLK